MRVVSFTRLPRANNIHVLDIPHPAFPEVEYYEERDVPEGSDAAYDYPEESHPEAEYADEGYGYAS